MYYELRLFFSSRLRFAYIFLLLRFVLLRLVLFFCWLAAVKQIAYFPPLSLPYSPSPSLSCAFVVVVSLLLAGGQRQNWQFIFHFRRVRQIHNYILRCLPEWERERERGGSKPQVGIEMRMRDGNWNKLGAEVCCVVRAHTHWDSLIISAAGSGSHIHIRSPKQLPLGADCVQGLSPLSSLRFWPAHYQPGAVGQLKVRRGWRRGRGRGTACPKLTVTMSNNWITVGRHVEVWSYQGAHTCVWVRVCVSVRPGVTANMPGNCRGHPLCGYAVHTHTHAHTHLAWARINHYKSGYSFIHSLRHSFIQLFMPFKWLAVNGSVVLWNVGVGRGSSSWGCVKGHVWNTAATATKFLPWTSATQCENKQVCTSLYLCDWPPTMAATGAGAGIHDASMPCSGRFIRHINICKGYFYSRDVNSFILISHFNILKVLMNISLSTQDFTSIELYSLTLCSNWLYSSHLKCLSLSVCLCLRITKDSFYLKKKAQKSMQYFFLIVNK